MTESPERAEDHTAPASDAAAGWPPRPGEATATHPWDKVLLEHAVDLLALLSPDGTIILASCSFQPVLGRTPASLVGSLFFELIHSDDLASARAFLAEESRLQSDLGLPLTVRLCRADGTWVIVEVVARYCSLTSSADGWVVQGRDVTTRTREARERAAEFTRREQLLHLNLSLAATHDRSELLRTLCEGSVEWLQAFAVVVADVNPLSGTLTIQRVCTCGSKEMEDSTLWEPLVCPDQFERISREPEAQCELFTAGELSEWDSQYLLERGLKVRALSTIGVDGACDALMMVFWREENAVPPDAVAACISMSTHASRSLAVARHNVADRESQRRAETWARRIDQVKRVSEWLKSDADEAEIAHRIVTAARDATGFQIVLLNLVDEPENPDAPWRVVEAIGLPPEALSALIANSFTVADAVDLFRPEFQVSRSYFIPTEHSEFVVKNDVPGWWPTLGYSGPNAWQDHDDLLVPLTDPVRGQLIGFISVSEPESRQRPELEDIQLLELFADQAVVALRNARKVARVRWQAEHDFLTGLANRRAAHAILERELDTGAASGSTVGVIALDIDEFKQINDVFGHVAGDAALQHLADLMTRCKREGDVASRLGGDEFIIILPGANAAQCRTVAERILSHAARRPLTIKSGMTIQLQLSCGSAVFPHDGSHVHALLSTADARLYEAKRAGRRTRGL